MFVIKIVLIYSAVSSYSRGLQFICGPVFFLFIKDK